LVFVRFPPGQLVSVHGFSRSKIVSLDYAHKINGIFNVWTYVLNDCTGTDVVAQKAEIAPPPLAVNQLLDATTPVAMRQCCMWFRPRGQAQIVYNGQGVAYQQADGACVQSCAQ
jgi:hypothetical protein